MILSPRVSTLVLRKEGDGYLSRGWCFVESMIAQSKDDPNMPLVLRTDRWSEPFSVFDETVEASMMSWEDPSSAVSAWEALSAAILPTGLPLVLKREKSTSEFALALADTINSIRTEGEGLGVGNLRKL